MSAREATLPRRSEAAGALRGWTFAFVCVALFLPSVWPLARAWSTEPYAGHGIFVPVLAVLMLWSRRHRLHSDGGHSGGLVLLALGLALAVLGHVSHSLTAHALAIVVATTGVALFLAGPDWVRQAAFPLGFLLFMLPLPRAFVEVVTLDLQQFVAGFASAALALGGVSVYQDGLLLHVPGITLRVDRGCNGVRFLTVLFVVVTAFAHMHLARGVQRLIVIAVAIPAAILANAFRVTAIVAATQLVGPHAASGWIHDYIGRSLWVAAIAAMLAFAILLGRTERQDLRAA